jgi:hypothetical protein
MKAVKKGVTVFTNTTPCRFGVTPGKHYQTQEVNDRGFYINSDDGEKCFCAYALQGNSYNEKWELVIKTENVILIEGPVASGKTTLANQFINAKIYDERVDFDPEQFEDWKPFSNIVYTTQKVNDMVLITILQNVAKSLNLNFTHLKLPNHASN